jgi:hypothetical protein
MGMSKTDENEQFDDDILKCKDDILRASEDIRPIDTGTPDEQKNDDSRQENTGSTQGETCKPKESQTVIPKFELHEQILGQERKISASARKAPGQKKQEPESQAQSGLIPDADSQQKSNEKEKDTDHIISEIVARDIEKLCRGES